MEIKSVPHFVFVDFENVPAVDLGVVEGKSVHVTLLIGKNQKRLDTAFSLQMHRCGDKVLPIEVGASGRNALDLTLAYYLGQAAQRTPSAHFYIVSKDKDFEALIEHLHGKGLKVVRCDSFASLPFLHRSNSAAAGKIVAAAGAKTPEDRRAKVIARLKDPANRSRPANRKRLLAHLKTSLGKESSDAEIEAILRELIDTNALSIDSKGKVGYAGGARGHDDLSA